MDQDGKRKKVGLALSGGFIRATAEIGVIEVLEENGIPIDIISGCSSGAAIGAAYAAGTLPMMKKRLSEGNRRDYWQIIFEPTVPHHGLLKWERSRRFFEEFVGDKHFIQLNKQVLMTATDLRTMEEVIIEEGLVSTAIQACTAVPGIFVPVTINNQILVDGGNFNMIPSKVLYAHGVDYVIAVDVSRQPNVLTRSIANFRRLFHRQAAAEKFTKNPETLHIFQLIGRTFRLSTTQIKNLYHGAYPYNVLIKPDVSRVHRASISLVDFCIQEGRLAALEMLPTIKRDLGL